VTSTPERSGFVDAGPSEADSANKDEEKRLEKVPVPIDFESLDFEKLCDQVSVKKKSFVSDGGL